MKTLRLSLFGHEIAVLEITEPTEPQPEGITGGGGGTFERDTEPVAPDDRYRDDWWYKFGFQRKEQR